MKVLRSVAATHRNHGRDSNLRRKALYRSAEVEPIRYPVSQTPVSFDIVVDLVRILGDGIDTARVLLQRGKISWPTATRDDSIYPPARFP